jgi:ERCC4-type nuclease
MRGRRKPRPVIQFVRDAHEKLPYIFTAPLRRDLAGSNPPFITKALSEADYTVRILGEPPVEISIRVERKTLSDLWGVCGYGRKRFERELARLTKFERRYLMIEADARTIMRGFERSDIRGHVVMASVLSWAHEFGIAPIFAGDRKLARAMTQRLLEEAAADAVKNLNGGQQ